MHQQMHVDCFTVVFVLATRCWLPGIEAARIHHDVLSGESTSAGASHAAFPTGQMSSLLAAKMSTAHLSKPLLSITTETSPSREWVMATLEAHNKKRKMHGAHALAWCEDCYREAKKQANICQKKNTMMHGSLGKNGDQGQNIYWRSRAFKTYGVAANAAVESWYDEVHDPGYDFQKNEYQSGTGHFSQVVWKSTTSVGMAVSNNGLFIVANYLPGGNVQGRFAQNVEQSSSVRAPPVAHTPVAGTVVKQPQPVRQGTQVTGPGPGVVTASSWTKELEAQFKDCPFENFAKEVKKAFQGRGDVTVTVNRKREDGLTKMGIAIVIKTTNGRRTSTSTRSMNGSWS